MVEIHDKPHNYWSSLKWPPQIGKKRMQKFSSWFNMPKCDCKKKKKKEAQDTVSDIIQQASGIDLDP